MTQTTPFPHPNRPPQTATGSTSGRIRAPQPTVRLGWSDPVTGERLTIVMDAHPEMLQRLQEEGFCVESEITRTAS